MTDRGILSYLLLNKQFRITTLMSGYTFYLYLYANTTHRKSCIVQHMDYIYPAKITIIEAENNRADLFYMVITVGEISISSKIKEALTNIGAEHPEMNRSLSDGGASFVMSIPTFIANFIVKMDLFVSIDSNPNYSLEYGK